MNKFIVMEARDRNGDRNLNQVVRNGSLAFTITFRKVVDRPLNISDCMFKRTYCFFKFNIYDILFYMICFDAELN